MTKNMVRLLLVAAGLAVVAVADFAWRSLSGPAGPVRSAATRAQVTSGIATAWNAPRPLEAYEAVFKAPLFSPRRFIDPPPPPPSSMPIEVAAPDPLDTAILVGVASGDSGDIALVQTDGQLLKLEPGDMLGEWGLLEIHAKSAVFTRNEEVRELTLAR